MKHKLKKPQNIILNMFLQSPFAKKVIAQVICRCAAASMVQVVSRMTDLRVKTVLYHK